MASLGRCWRLSNLAPRQYARANGPAPGIRPVSTASRTASQAKRARLVPALAATTVFMLGVGVYTSRRAKVRMALAQEDKHASLEKPLALSLEPATPTPGQLAASRAAFHEALDDTPPLDIAHLPAEDAQLTSAPHVPPTITRRHPILLRVPLTTATKLAQVTNQHKYEQWAFNGTVPGPFIRARAGDVVELALTNRDATGNRHNVDSHAFTGPGGGAAVTTAEEGEARTARFRLLCPGLYVYHCATAPVPVHIANGMYGLMYRRPAPMDREYYVMQSEVYHEPPEVLADGRPSPTVAFSYPGGLREEPGAVVFNGTEALTRDRPLKARAGESVRIFFGNVGPNLTSSFHVIGSHFRRVYRDGDVLSPPGRFVGTVSVPPGGATIVDMKMVVPGTYTLVDHAIFRLDKGAVGFLNVSGEARPDVYQSTEPPAPCVGCKLHA
ncbi:Copper-containing nitrite reductase [Tolypocladium paradoxum]|uniref:Copper-containing nitrite reductase n=1 Tax=Tolypocladium paradoxum TaxID=94208 RepID=A0A2S4KNM6_9HYPO|nr:Copper-containing nitrite reductase [Tolypocladium paradoxum]